MNTIPVNTDPPPCADALPPTPLALGDLVAIETLEEVHIRRVLARCASLKEAARVLGMDPATLWRRRKKYRI